MGTAAIVGLGLLKAGVAAKQRNQEKAASRQAVAAAEEQAQLDINELTRQQEEANTIAQERRSDRVREADKSFASMVVALAEGGGAGTINEARAGQEVGFIEGLDLARIEGNRRREVSALQSRKVAAKTNLKNIKKREAQRRKASTTRFLGTLVDTASGGLASVQAANANKDEAS